MLVKGIFGLYVLRPFDKNLILAALPDEFMFQNVAYRTGVPLSLNPKFLRSIEILLITAAETKSAAVKQHEEST